MNVCGKNSFLWSLFIAFLLISVQAKSQFVNYGTDPARIKWKVLKTPHYKLIFPESNDSAAYRYALFLENSLPYMGNTIGNSKIRSFPVILHPKNMISNGLVVWAPRRMELITTPSTNLSSQSWDKHLVLHESRHVLQMRKMSQGIFKPLTFLIGEQTVGIATSPVPKWFFEGDAVATETAMSNSGRGRLPEFNIAYRAQMLSDKFYTYDKWALGSYKDYTGNYYALGYNLASFARYRYGKDIWDKVTSRYTRRWFNIPPFSKALKHYTGADTKTLFKETFDFLSSEWTTHDSVYNQSDFKNVINYITPQTKQYTSYKSLQVSEDSSVIAVKTSLHDINSLVIIKDGKEKCLCYLGNINSKVILNNNRIYWTENISGKRWTHENYSDLKYYDLTTGKTVFITFNQRIMAPAINSPGELAAVSQPSVSGVNRVALIDIMSGKELKSYDVPANGFVKEITFIDDNNIAAIAINDKGLCILQLNTVSGQWDELIKPSFTNMTSLSYHSDKLFFESGLDGTNNIYSFDITSSHSIRLTSSRFGAFSPVLSKDGNTLFFTDYSAKGTRIASVPTGNLLQESADFNEVYNPVLAETIAQQEQFNLDMTDMESVVFNPKPYRKAAHLFNIHSWMPFYFDAINAVSSLSDDLSTIVRPGSIILSQNALSTMMTQAGWYYSNGFHYGKMGLSYAGWFPVINLSVEYGGKAFNAEWLKNDKNNDILAYNITNRNLIDAEAQIYVPINLTRNHYISGIQPSVIYSFTNNQYQQYGNDKFSKYSYMLAELRYYRYRRLAQQELLPRFGYQIRLQFLNIPFDTKNFGNIYAAGLTTYWPGLVRGHGLMLRAIYQYQNMDGKTLYAPQKLISQPRGYSYDYRTQQKLEFKADYSFSIFCPDWSIKGLAYIQRLRSNLFYDISKNQAYKQSGWSTQSSFGADFILDCNLLRFSYPVSLGVRVINPVDYGNVQTEALFSLSF